MFANEERVYAAARVFHIPGVLQELINPFVVRHFSTSRIVVAIQRINNLRLVSRIVKKPASSTRLARESTIGGQTYGRGDAPMPSHNLQTC
jgi:hypothetical protein